MAALVRSLVLGTSFIPLLKDQQALFGEKMSFQVGDTVVKPSLGICKITGVRKMEVEGKSEEYLVVHSGEVKVMIPRARAEAGDLRRLATLEEMEKTYSLFDEPLFFDEDDLDNPYHLDYKVMDKAISGRDPMSLAAWVRALFNNEKDMPTDKRANDYWTRMMRLITEEFSHIEHTTKGKITVKVKGLLQAARKKRKGKI
jgi:RNA polymerase-interacting CarD/CdnL/TRCF family regulator